MKLISRIRFSAALVAVVQFLQWSGNAGEITMRSDYIMVRCETNTARITIARATSEPLIDNVQVGDGTVASVRQAAFTNKAFRAVGKSLEITHSNGGRSLFAVFQGSPFLLFRPAIQHNGSNAIVTNKIAAFSGQVSYWRGETDIKAFGTGGLSAPEKNPGSYAWLGLVEPATRSGIVFGWLTHDRGSGVWFTSPTNGRTQVSARLDYGRLRLPAGSTAELETLVIGHFSDVRLGLEQWADAVAKVYEIKLPPQPTGYCTWYSRPHGRASDEAHISELAGFASTNLAPYGFSVVQIDDGWQPGASTNGPKRNFTTHAPNGPYKAGMKAAAETIRSVGLVPGLWYMPFAGTYYDPFFADHPEWFVKRTNNAPYETAWGGTCLDMTHPGARNHLSNVTARITREWGYSYVKIDGLWTGTATKQQYVNSGYREDNMGDAVFSNPEKTNIEAYRDGLRLLRRAAGNNVFILGCNGPQNMRSYAGAFGLLDGMRVGPDNGTGWDKLLRGPAFGSRHYFLHGRIWWNDPDPVYVRADMPLNHARLICSWVAVSGQMNLSSEWLPGLPAERLEILKRTMPSHGMAARPVDIFEQDVPRIWHVMDQTRSGRQSVIGLFNWEDVEVTIDYALDRIGVNPLQENDVFDFWENTMLPPWEGRLQVTLPPQSCRVIAIRPRASRPHLISTSRHVTHGLIDVIEERWDEPTRTLRGRSKVIKGEPYELRIVSDRAAGEMEVAGAETKIRQDQNLVRATFTSPESGEVAWAVRFD